MGKKPAENINKKRDAGKTIAVLFKISESVNTTRNLDELYRVIHENLDEILNVDNFSIAIHNKEKDSIFFPYHVDEKDKNMEELRNFSQIPSLTGLVIKNKKPMILYEQDIVRLGARYKQKVPGTLCKVWMGAPLIINDRVKGAIIIQSYESPDVYDKKDLDLLNSVSQHIALAIERKESDRALAEQRKILEKILESSPVGIALVQNRNFKWVNNEMVRMFGYQSKSDFENKNARMIYSDGNEYDLIGEKIYNSLGKNGIADYEINLKKKDKTLFPIHIRLNCDDISNPMAWTIATFIDISQRKAVEKEKYEKERLQGVLEMAGAVCHEINQPLQAILGYTELLSIDQCSDADLEKRTVNSIKTQVSRLSKITRELSKITRYRTVDYPGNTKIVDIWGSGSDIKG